VDDAGAVDGRGTGERVFRDAGVKFPWSIAAVARTALRTTPRASSYDGKTCRGSDAVRNAENDQAGLPSQLVIHKEGVWLANRSSFKDGWGSAFAPSGLWRTTFARRLACSAEAQLR
jgi:hypothetical protein